MTTTMITPRTQISVLVALLLLTGATVAVSFFEIPGQWHLASGLGIAILKASLVALFFMHVIHSRAATWGVMTIAVFWLVALLIGLTLSDYLTRGATPGAPGH